MSDLFARAAKANALRGTAELDEWRLDLTCDHFLQKTAHRSNSTGTSRVEHCPTCEARRGVVQAHRIGPANDPHGQVQRQRASQEVRAATAKLTRQRAALARTEREIQELNAKLGDQGPVADTARPTAG